MPQVARPLSPHIQVYRWPLSMALSIVHRATGVVLALGTLLIVWFLLALANGPESYASVRALCASWFGMIVLFGWSWALAFHLANGVRHLFWDAGKGYSIQQAKTSGVVVVVLSLILTGLIWGCVILSGTGAQGGSA
ncbi:MAG: succinate dehydrogenase, cytochrome b556 subunit [Rudaea sp.]